MKKEVSKKTLLKIKILHLLEATVKSGKYSDKVVDSIIAYASPPSNDTGAKEREGWISVEDRLPTKYGEYIVLNQGTVHSALWDGSFYSVSAMGTHRHIDIIKWRPLPTH